MQVVKVGKNFQITLPVKARNEINIKEGDFVEVEVTKDGILLKPKEVIDKNQAWFWTKEWQEEEKKVEEDFRKGKVKKSKNVEEFIKELHK